MDLVSPSPHIKVIELLSSLIVESPKGVEGAEKTRVPFHVAADARSDLLGPFSNVLFQIRVQTLPVPSDGVKLEFSVPPIRSGGPRILASPMR